MTDTMKRTAVTVGGGTVTDLEWIKTGRDETDGHYTGMIQRGLGSWHRAFWDAAGLPNKAENSLPQPDFVNDALVIIGGEPLDPANRIFTIERQYLMPVYQHVVVAAPDPQTAMRLAMDEDRFDWATQQDDVESSRPHYITACWEGDDDHPQVDGEPVPSLPVPADMGDPDEKRAGQVATLLVAVRELVSAYGGDVPDWLAPEFGMVENALLPFKADKMPAPAASSDENITFRQGVDALADVQGSWPNAARVIAAAREEHEREGEIEIDDRTIVSADSNAQIEEHGGGYVLAWVWAGLPE